MRESRLSLALSSGAVALPPEGPVAVFSPSAEADLAPLARARVQIVQPFRPDHDAWAARAYDSAPACPEGVRFAAALVYVPRARAHAQALIAQALTVTGGGPVLVDGQKTDGIEPLLRACRARGSVSAPVIGGHGKLFALTAPPAAFADWAARPGLAGGRFRTVPGTFSADGIDAGSALLAAALPAGLKGHVADLGAGWGYLAAEALARCPGLAQLHLVEADAEALDCARHNVTDARAVFHWADARAFAPPRLLDAVITNPPFHAGRAADPALGIAFLAAAAAMLAPHGALYAVANRHLPYERELSRLFHELTERPGTGGFKVLHAVRPIRAPRPRR